MTVPCLFLSVPGQWLQTTLEMHLAELPSLAKPAKVQPSYCGRRGADEQIVAADIAFKARNQPANGLRMVVVPRWLSWDGRVVSSDSYLNLKLRSGRQRVRVLTCAKESATKSKSGQGLEGEQ